MSMSYFGIGIENTKNGHNVGTLWRSAFALGASYIFTIGRRYKHQASDTSHTEFQLPYFHYNSFEEFYASLPYAARLVGVELDENSLPIEAYTHPGQAVYLLGAEDLGLSKKALSKCHELIQLPGSRCLNVSVAGSLVMYDRKIKK